MRKIQKLFLKRLCAGAAAACTVLAALPGIPVMAGEKEARGRYLETDVVLPQEDAAVRDVVRTAEGTLRILTHATDGIRIWDSADGGASWEQTGELPQEYAGVYMTDIALNPQGGGACILFEDGTQETGEEAEAAGEEETGAEAADGEEAETESENSEEAQAGITTKKPDFTCSLLLFDKEGSAQVHELDNGMDGYLQYAADGTLLCNSFGGGIYRLAEDGSVAGTVADKYADYLGVCRKEALLVCSEDSEVLRYDYSTGDPLQRDEALDTALFEEQASYMKTTSLGGPIAMTEDEDGRLYYATQKGIFSHVMEGGVVEQLVDGSLCSLADPGTALLSMAVVDQCFYLAVSGGSAPKLLQFKYDPEIASTPDTELTVYSLRESDAIRQAAVLFQKEHPDVYVHYRAGLSGSDGMTAADAIRTLNTDILAGSGPDVLVLDELSVETYAGQGLLTDLTDVISETAESDGLLENITGAYQSEDGLFAVPAKFGIMVAAGQTEAVNGAQGLASLETLAAQEDTMDAYDVVNLGEILYRCCAGSWKNDDNTIDQEKLSEFVNCVKQTNDVYRENASEKTKERLQMYADGTFASWTDMENAGIQGDDMALGTMDLASESCRVKFGTLNDILEYAGLTSIRKIGGDCSLQLLSMRQSGVFVPSCVLGIPATAKEPEQARAFVQYMLSESGQTQNEGRGFPVNKKALENELYTNQFEEGGGFSVGTSNDDGEFIEFTYEWPTTEELDALYELLQQADTRASVERVQHDVVMEELKRCLGGEIGADEAVNAMMQKLNLYLAE